MCLVRIMMLLPLLPPSYSIYRARVRLKEQSSNIVVVDQIIRILLCSCTAKHSLSQQNCNIIKITKFVSLLCACRQSDRECIHCVWLWLLGSSVLL